MTRMMGVRSAADWRLATFAFLPPGMVGLVGAAAGAVTVSATSGGPRQL